jgi:hypothetical protein
MQFGTMVHAKLLERDTFSDRYPLAQPCCAFLSSGKRAGQPCDHSGIMQDRGGSWYCGIHAKQAPGAQPIECLTPVDAAKLAHIERAAYADPKVRGCLEAVGDVEYSLFGTHTETGLAVRSRLDKVFPVGDKRALIDLKTCSFDPCDDRLVAAAIHQRGYHRQAAWYLDMMEGHGKPCDVFFFVFIRTAPPYNSVLWSLNDNAIDLGRRRNDVALRNLYERLQSGDWAGPRHGELNYVDLPKYAYSGSVDDMTFPIGDFLEFAG